MTRTRDLAGHSALLLATLTALILTTAEAGAQKVLHTVNGDNANDAFGQVVDILGDVDGDGCADFMAGAWRDDNTGGDSGSVRVHSGKTGAILWTFNGDLPGDHMGWGSSAAGDVNGDGFADIAAAADEADINGNGNAGTVKVMSGKTGLLIWKFDGTTPSELLGWSSGRVGDVNADGKADIIVGAIFGDAPGKANCGSAAVVSGATGLALYTVFGDSSGDQFGYSCYGAGDVNLDGVPDFIVGAPADDNGGAESGTARLFSGATAGVLRTFQGDSAGDGLGRSVSGAGDVNLDGRADVVVGAHLDDNTGGDAGMVRVFSGATLQPLTSLNGDSAGDRLGAWVRDAGDVNGDGHPDFCAGAPGDDNNGGDSGSLRVYSGLDYSILATLNGDGAGDGLGTSCGGGGDVNGDGFFDVVAGAPGDDNNGGGSGSARAYSLVPQGITHLTPGTPGCAGMQLLNGSTVPKVNTPGFLVFGSRMPPTALNLLLAADAQTLTGGDPLGVGASFYVDFFAATFILGFDVGSDAKGVGGVNVPIPNDPALAGKVVTFQLASVWGAPCGLGPLNLSTSIAAVATIQP